MSYHKKNHLRDSKSFLQLIHRKDSTGNLIYKALCKLLSTEMVKSNSLPQLARESHQRFVFPSCHFHELSFFNRPCLVAANSVSFRKASMKVWHLVPLPLTLWAQYLQLAEVLFFFFPFSSDRVICIQFRKHSRREPPKDKKPVYLTANQPNTWFLEQQSNWLGILSVPLADANKQACLLTIYLQNTDWFQERNITSLCKVRANDFFRALK